MPFLKRQLRPFACLCLTLFGLAAQPAAATVIYIPRDVWDLALGNRYRDGRIGHPNPEKARYWYEESADLGNRDAMFALGQLYSS